MKPPGIPWTKYIRLGVGRRLSLIGEKYDIDFLTYNPLVMLMFHEMSCENAPKLVPAVLKTFPEANSFFDVGCGSGAFAAVLQKHGRRVVACERSRVGQWLARRQGIDCRDFDLTRSTPCEITGRFDVVTCFEVAEHLPPELGEGLVRFICDHAENVIFTAAHPGQGGTGHINEQPKKYWIDRFETHQFNHLSSSSEFISREFQQARAADYFAANACIFSRMGEDSQPTC